MVRGPGRCLQSGKSTRSVVEDFHEINQSHQIASVPGNFLLRPLWFGPCPLQYTLGAAVASPQQFASAPRCGLVESEPWLERTPSQSSATLSRLHS